jgi:hypothetical protein
MTTYQRLKYALRAARESPSVESLLYYWKLAGEYWQERPEARATKEPIFDMIDKEIAKLRACQDQKTPCLICKYFESYRRRGGGLYIMCTEKITINKNVVERLGCRYKKIEPELHERIVFLCDDAKGGDH